MSTGSHAGRPKSWVAVAIAAITVVGGIVALAVDIMTDVIVDDPRQ